MKRLTFISLTTLLAGLHISSWASNNKINNDLLAKSNPQVAGLTTNKYSVLYRFHGGNDGASPEAGLVVGADGNLYGTTAADAGTVFKVTPQGVKTTLYSFQGGNDGDQPMAGLMIGADGNFYGTTAYGGGYGTVFKVTPQGVETTLYSFQGGGNDGNNLFAGLIQDVSGNLYGTASGGSSNGYGAVFKVTPQGVETTLYSFHGGNDGASPAAGLTVGVDGNAYGTTYGGGSADKGTVYKITATGQETVLYSFQGSNDGANPLAGLIRDESGNFYGTTVVGGSGYGTVFKITPQGQETVLYSFQGGADGAQPFAGLIQDASGNLYGTTYVGGSGYGTVFKITPQGQETVLHSFQGGDDDGANPAAGLIQDESGNLYGTTEGGGGGGFGTVFKIQLN
jgi:uncharacterized repeat protein (TIGR03803 family)